MTYGPRPRPTQVMHYTDIANVASIATVGLIADTGVASRGIEFVESGSPTIKQRRRMTAVTCGPRGRVSDYVPFYFAPRSPMMCSVYVYGKFPEIVTRLEEQVYLVTTTERLSELGHTVVMSDGNAAAPTTRFGLDGDLDEVIDWPLMRQASWGKTTEDTGRPERRQAETLVHERVSWEAIQGLVVHNTKMRDRVQQELSEVMRTKPVMVESSWYPSRRG